ncbi:unnamed protein product [Closterium sp. NIES-54]
MLQELPTRNPGQNNFVSSPKAHATHHTKPSSLKTVHLLHVYSLRSLPPSIQKLAKPIRLTIGGCRSFQLPGGLSKLKRLKQLHLELFEELLPLPEDFGNLRALECLFVRRVKGITELPETVGLLPQLQQLTIDSYSSSSWLPRSLPNVSTLTELNFTQPGGVELPDGIGQLSKLKSIKLASFVTAVHHPRPSSLPRDFGQLSALEILILSDLTQLSHLPDSFTMLSSLQKLEIRGCSRLTALPEGTRDGLHHLRKLTLSHIAITHLPASFFHLSSLQAVDLCGLQCLRDCLLEGFSSFSHLRDLSLTLIPHLTSLPASLSPLALSLTSLTVQDCSELKSLPEEIGQLQMLEKLELSKLDGLESIPRSLLKLPRLRELGVSHCKSLGGRRVDPLVGGRSNCSSSSSNNNLECVEVEVLPSLQSLTINDVSSEILYSSLVCISSLTKLRLECMPALCALPASISRLSNLRSLFFSNATCLKALPETVCRLSRLTYPCLHSLPNLLQLPEMIGRLKKLEWQRVAEDAGDNEEYDMRSDSMRGCNQHLPRLNHPQVNHCMRLPRVPLSFPRLDSLKCGYIPGTREHAHR